MHDPEAPSGLEPPTAIIDELIGLARHFGADPDFSRGGGGNASAKADGVLWIKPSGVSLATLAAEALVPLDMAQLLALLDVDPASLEPGEDPVMRVAAEARLAHAHGRRPSVELLFHALFPQRFVLHTHPILINAVSCNRDGQELAARLFGDAVVWVPYTDPGLQLAAAIAAARRAHEERTGAPAPQMTLLGNHGLVVTGETAREIEDATAWLVARIAEAVAATPEPYSTLEQDPDRVRQLVDALAPALRASLSSDDERRILVFDDDPVAAGFTTTAEGRAFVAGAPLTPDQIVYAGSWPLLLDIAEDADPSAIPVLAAEGVAAHAARTGAAPIVTVVPGLGLFAVGDTWAQADTARHIYLDALRVGAGAVRLGAVRHLSASELQFIEAWEAEAYRKQISAGDRSRGRLAGRVALVTGAAQGFGLAIAEGLIREGAHVVLADINVALAEQNAARLAELLGPGAAAAVPMNVTDEASVADGIHAAVRCYGGLDLLVSNAGVLRAGSVTGQPLADFDLVTRVNYRGYFLCVRFAAPVMTTQHAVRPAWLGDIIEINSKSGLAGSSRNSAYAGSKFGGIGLTQSFALELVGDGIKVNAICPGNFFEGPLWSDPVNGLFVQYLREGKVPGATTVEDVRRSYESKVPMGRGCSPADILEAINYLVAQQYETGQALPVTGGQVMLS